MAEVQKEIALKVTTDVGQTTKAFANAQQELEETRKALVDLALAGKQGSAEFKQMEQRAGQLQDAIGDVNRRVTNLANDTPKLQLLTEAATAIAGGFAIAQGAAALFGDENEEVQQAILKTQAAMSLLNGVQSVANVINKDAALGDMLATKAKNAYTAALGTSTGALKLFRLALIATGIGAAVVAVGALVANWDKLTGAVMRFVNESPMLTKILSFITRAVEKVGEALGFVDDSLTKSLKTQIEVFEKQKRLLEAQGKDTFEIEKTIIEKKLELAKKNNEDLSELQEQLTLLEAREQVKRNAEREKANEKRIADEKKALEEIKKLREQAAKDQKDIDQIGIDAQNQLVERAKEAAQQLFDIDEKRRRERLTDDQKRREDLINESNARIALLRETGASELEVQMEQNRLVGILKQEAADKEVAIDKAKNEKLKADRQQVFDAIVATTTSGLQAIADLSALFAGKSESQQRKAFEVQKKLNIATTIIDSLVSAQKIFKSTSDIPVVGAILAPIAAASALAAGFARVAAIRNTTFNSATASPVAGIRQAGISQGQVAVPQGFNPNQTPTGGGQLPPNGNGMAAGAQRVFVLERDIRNVGQRVNAAERFATFG